MKIILVIGSFVVVSAVFLIRFFYRIGKPVNAQLSDSYYHHAWKKKIVYAPMGNWFELDYRELAVEPSEFVVLAREYGKDDRSVFWKGRKQEVDAATFGLDANNMPKDATHVYADFGSTFALTVIEDADPGSYEPFSLNEKLYYHHWGRDRHAVFLEGRKVDVDRNTFILLNETFASDSTGLYSIETDYASPTGNTEIKVVRRTNPSGEKKIISPNYLQAGNTIYLSNWKSPFASVTFGRIDSIRIIDDRNIVVNTTALVSDGELLADVDIASLDIIHRDYLKDKDHVFYDRKKIVGADARTFTVLTEDYAKDHQHAFYKDRLLDGVNGPKFTVNFATGIATDGVRSFKDGVPVAGK